MNEIKMLKDRLTKINELLDKLDEKLVFGDITEAKYQELSDKYRAEGDSLKNQIVETELLQEFGLNEEKTEAVESPKPEKKKILQEIGLEAEREEAIEPPKVKTEDTPYVSSEGHFLSSFLWMMGLSFFLFWIPLLGPFIVGFIGSKKAGSTEKAMLAGIIPIILMFVLAAVVFEDNDSDAIIASILFIPILVVIGVIMSSRIGKNEDMNTTISAFFWMMLISVFVFWVPYLGSFIVGYVGGKKAGNTKNAILAGIIPIILIIAISVEVFGDYSSSFYTDNGVIIASILLSPIIVIIGAIKGSRASKREAKTALNGKKPELKL